MPREPRVHAESGFYHVILRGNGKQLLFETDDDRLHFLKLLRGKTQSGGVSVLAWCLLSNHIHLLLSDPQDNLSCVMHGLATAYSRYFNSASGHIGAVFQGRFTSVPIKSDRQLLQALRYIHDNPEKAGVAPAGEYRWSSYGEYLVGAQLVDDGVVLDLIGGRSQFPTFCNDGRYAAYFVRAGKRVADEDAMVLAREVLAGASPAELTSLPKERRDDALRALRRAGLMVKQIERLTGIGASTISRVTARPRRLIDGDPDEVSSSSVEVMAEKGDGAKRAGEMLLGDGGVRCAGW